MREMSKSIEYSSNGIGGVRVSVLRRCGMRVGGGNWIFGIWKATIKIGSRLCNMPASRVSMIKVGSVCEKACMRFLVVLEEVDAMVDCWIYGNVD